MANENENENESENKTSEKKIMDGKPADKSRMSESAQDPTPQKHENRTNPDKDHVPGHKGYDRSNLENVNPTRREP
jgi:hypothetical protein